MTETPTGPVIVCVGDHPKTSILLRTAKQRAMELGIAWEAVHVKTPGKAKRVGPDSELQALQSLTLAEQMGAAITHVEAPTAYEGIAKILRERAAHGVPIPCIVVGEEEKQGLREKLSLTLGRRIRGMLPPATLVEVVALDGSLNSNLSWYERLRMRDIEVQEVLYALVAVLLAFVSAEALRAQMPPLLFRINDQNVALLFMIACAFSAGRYGLLPGLVAAVASFVIMNFFYVPPYQHFAINDITVALNLGLFLFAALLIAFFVSHMHAYAEEVVSQYHKTQALFRLHRVTLQINSRAKLMETLHAELKNLLECEVAFFLPSPLHSTELEDTYPDDISLTDNDRKALMVCWQEGKTTGVASPYNPGSDWRFELLFTTDGDIGVLGMHIAPGYHLQASTGRLLSAISSQVALILERIELAKIMETAKVREEREKLRAMLLSSVSHDLKTPLASIIGSLSVYRSMGHMLTEEQRKTLINTAQEEAQRLDSFITNILDMTRIESGEIEFQQEWTPPEAILKRVTKRMRDRLDRHNLVVDTCEAPIEVYADVMMTEQVLQNVLDNAVKYTPPGTRIEVSCAMESEAFVYRVRDQGQGIPADKLETIFDKYARLHKEDTQIAGTGLGLAICKSSMQVQGGDITASNHPDGGAVFTIRLPNWRRVNVKKRAV